MVMRLLSCVWVMAWAFGAVPAFAQTPEEVPQPRGFLGVNLKDLTQDEAAKLGFASPRGAKVLSVGELTPAANAGIMVDDVITHFDGREVADRKALLATILETEPGARVEVKFLRRSNQEQKVTVTLGQRTVDGASFPPPQDPILTIDAGMHTASINRVGANSDCTMLATGSNDNTVRLWRLPEGKLIRTLRPPFGPEYSSKIHAVAVAPDGAWVAAGGVSTERAHFVYIFETATGSLSTRLGPFDRAVGHLAVSTDGRYLAATIYDGRGLRVWEKSATGWRLVVEDLDYAGPAFGAAFDRAGVLYTVAWDGKIRRYASGLGAKPISIETRSGKRPYSVAVHPSGDKVAVGFSDAAAVDIYDAATLEWRFAAKSEPNRANGAVAWSEDGSQLFAGGSLTLESRGPRISAWDQAGQGALRQIEGGNNTIFHLMSCGGGIAVGAADPAFGLVAADGSRRLWKDSVQPDLRGLSFALAADGRRIHFGVEPGGKSPVLFDLTLEQISDDQNLSSAIFKPDRTSIAVKNWRNALNPELGGIPLLLTKGEITRSLAIASDKEQFVLGSEWTLRGFDKAGKLQWRKGVRSVVWDVAISGDGKLVVAGYGDGTVRWHRLSDGQELLALFVHKLDRRWVAWTPKGYYIASPGAESLIGWHVNGKSWDEAAQFYSADRFRDQFNRPDIVKLVLETLDERAAVEQANKQANRSLAVEDVRDIAPPIVTIQDPGDGATFRTSEVTINYNIFSSTGKATRIGDVRVNNSAVRANILPGKKENNWTSGQYTMTLPAQDVTITFVARDEDDKASEPVSIRLRWDGAKLGEVARPRLRALFVGIDAYTLLNKLQFAAKDASDLAAFFKAHEGKSYSKVDAMVLPRDAKRADVINGLEWLEKQSEAGIASDVNLLFFAGHGATDDKQNFYYMAADSDPRQMRATAVSKDDIIRTIRNLKQGSRIVMLDACHSGAGADAASRVDMSRAANELGDQSLGVLLYASARARQYSEERDEWRNGAFTKAMIEGLSGKADGQKLGFVEADELGLYVRRTVKTMTNNRQEPTHALPYAAPDMQLVLLK